MDNLQESINKVLNEVAGIKATVASKEDVQKIAGRLDKLEHNQQCMSVSQTDIKRRIDALEKEKVRLGPHPRPLREQNSSKNQDKFIEARRSLYLSPVIPNVPNIKDFLLSKMQVPQDLVADLEITNIRKIYPRNLPAHRRSTDGEKKVHISLRDSHERDVVISYATNLEPGNRIEIVVPEHLRSLKSQFDNLGYKIRRHASLAGQKKVMTSLRLDDGSQSLVMAVRDNKDEPWLNYSIGELRELESKLGVGEGSVASGGEEEV